jgi:hypothetical protein
MKMKIWNYLAYAAMLLFVIANLVLGPQVTALAAEAKKEEPKSELKTPGSILRPLDKYGNPDYTKPYWKVDRHGNLIQYEAGTQHRRWNGQNYRVEGQQLQPIDRYGSRQYNKPRVKLNDR